MRRAQKRTPYWMLGLSLLLVAAQGAEELHEAARAGDQRRVAELLEMGRPVDEATRYGVTALFFACDSGHLEVARLLLDAGADPARKDKFYGARPIDWALQKGHIEVAKLLLDRGSPGADQALALAVRQGYPGLVEPALASRQLTREGALEAAELAREKNDEDLAAAIESRAGEIDVRPPAYSPDPERLKSYAGSFRSNDGVMARVSQQQDRLHLQLDDQEPRVLLPLDEGFFEISGLEDSRIRFAGRAGTVERVAVETSGKLTMFFPHSEGEAEADPPARTVVGSARIKPSAAGTNWPSFRGPSATGIGTGAPPPLEWDLETGHNVLWKTPIPGLATASPIIWGDRIFVTTAISPDTELKTGLYGDVAPVEDLVEHDFVLIALDRKTGKEVWRKSAFRGRPLVKRHPKASQANSTPATDGRHVVTLFGSVGLLSCFDFEGNLLWERDLGALDSGWFYNPDYQWGHSSSPIIYEGKVIVQADLQKDSFLAAFDLTSGREIWRTERDEIPTWGTPTVVETANGAEIVTNGTTVRGYDPASGKELWKLGPNSEVVVATPVAGEGLIFITAGYPPVRPIYAVHPGARGDISPQSESSNSSLAWSKSRGGTYIPTPIVYQGYLYTNANNGRLTCYEAATGKRVYQQRIGGTGGAYSASPVAAAGRIYFTSEDGDVFVAKAGAEYEQLAKNDVGEACMSTPAISDGLLLIRTLRHLIAIGSKTDSQ